jgi:hypothetical protein
MRSAPGCPLWVKSRHVQCTNHVRFTPNSDRKSGPRQNTMSALPLKADVCGANRYVCFGPKADSCSAANGIAIRSPHLRALLACLERWGPSALAVFRIVLQVALFHQKSAHFPHEVAPRRQPVAALIMGCASRGHPAAPRLGTGEARPTI